MPGLPVTLEGWDAEEDACTEDHAPPGVLFHTALRGFFSLLLPFLIADDMTENIGLIILVSEARA